VGKDASGAPRGIVPDLAAELAKRLCASLAFVHFDQAGALADGAKAGAWDAGFLGAEPQRAAEILFTPAYLEIETGYLVPAGSKIQRMEDVDRPGVRIAVSSRAAYDLYLSRNLKHAELVRAEGIEGSYQLFLKEKLDVLAGLKARLLSDQASTPGSRVLEGSFSSVQQAIGTPKGRDAAGAFLRAFRDELVSSGLVARLIEKHQVRGVAAAR
jgi:polar amino acid transport system substrate-binding protein